MALTVKKKKPSAKPARKKKSASGISGKKKPAGPADKRKKAVAEKKAAGKSVKAGKVTKAGAPRKTGKQVSPVRPSKKRTTKGASPASKQDRLASLKRGLLERKESILGEAKQEIAKYLRGENRQLVDTALDDGDWAVVDINEDISLRMLAAHKGILHDIDEAIRKIDEGTYGICEECGEEISEKRLRILPAAVYCIDCQESKEKLSVLTKEQPL